MYRPYEGRNDGRDHEHVFELNKFEYFVAHADGTVWDYDDVVCGRFYEWRGVFYQRGLDASYDMCYRLHDPEFPRLVIWADVGWITKVPDSEMVEAAANPGEWLIKQCEKWSP